MKDFVSLIGWGITGITAVALLVLAWFWVMLVALGFAGFLISVFIVSQLCGSRLVIKNTKTGEVVGHLKYFKFHKVQ